MDYPNLTDEELMERLCYRDIRAFEILYDRYDNLVYSVTLRIVRDVHSAEDLVQDIFLRLWRKPERYSMQRGRFLTWLLTVTRNRAVDELRTRGRRFRQETVLLDGNEREISRNDANDPFQTAHLVDERRRVQRALASLPPEQREVIELAYFRGMTQQEISQLLAQPLGTVKTRIRLGMQKLRTSLLGKQKE